MEDKFIVQKNEKVGRYVVAGQDLKAGEAFFIEKPFSYGPKIFSSLICLGCHSELGDISLCTICSWPVCGENCSQLDIHKKNECQIFKSANIIYNIEGDPSTQLQCICPLRTILESERNKEEWDSKISTMEAHMEKRKAQEDTWSAEQINVVQFLLQACKLSGRFTEELIQKVCGILTVNCYEIAIGTGSNVRGLYFKGGLLSHNCVANTTHSLTGDAEFTMVFRTTVNVEKGAELFSSYTSCTEPTMIRRYNLLTSKYFSCDCPRCSDPTELGTNMSSLKCTKCDNGIILSSNPLDVDAPWKCSHCDYGVTGVGVQRIYSVIQDQINNLEMMEYTGEKLEATEKVLKQYRSILHPCHGWNVALWQMLTQMYGRIEGYTLDMLPDILLEHKAKLCGQLLKIQDVICPGITRERGMNMYELHVALLLFNRSRYEYKEFTMGKFKEEMIKVADILREAVKILGHEPETRPEGAIAIAARESLIKLELSIEQLKDDPNS